MDRDDRMEPTVGGDLVRTLGKAFADPMAIARLVAVEVYGVRLDYLPPDLRVAIERGMEGVRGNLLQILAGNIENMESGKPLYQMELNNGGLPVNE